MNASERERFEKLAIQCETYLREQARQSCVIYRGDMRAITAAARLIRGRTPLTVGSSPKRASANQHEGSRP